MIAWDISIIFSSSSCMVCASFIYDSCIQGYHKYKSIWDVAVGEILCCGHKMDDPYDDHVVMVICRGVTVGHVPRYVSQGFSLFLQLGGNITATVVSSRRYSRDLSQGGLEILCQYTLDRPTNEVSKIRIFLASCESNYKLVKSNSEELMCNSNVIKTEPSNGRLQAKTEPKVNVLMSIAVTSTIANEILLQNSKTVLHLQKNKLLSTMTPGLGLIELFLSLMIGIFYSMGYAQMTSTYRTCSCF